MLDADALAVEGVVGVGDVAGGEHARARSSRGARRRGCRCRRRGRPARRARMRGSTPTPTTTKSQSSARPSLVRTRSTASSPSKASTPVPISISHAVVGVDVAVDGADLGAQHALERDRGRLDDGDLEAALAGRGGDLGADPAGPDDDDRAAAVQPLAQRVGVVRRCAGTARRRARRPGIASRRGSAPVASSSRS